VILISKYNISDQISAHIYSTHMLIYYSSLTLYRFRKCKKTERTVRQIIAKIKKPAIMKATIAAVRHRANPICDFANSSGKQSEDSVVVAVVTEGRVVPGGVVVVVISGRWVVPGGGVVVVVAGGCVVPGGVVVVTGVVVVIVVVVTGVVVVIVVVVTGVVVVIVVVITGVVVVIVVVVGSTRRKAGDFIYIANSLILGGVCVN
jgi:hypothetical protein